MTHPIAEALFRLRKENRAEPTERFDLPASLAEAVDIQGVLAALEGAEDKAWKVAMSPDKHPVVAPLFPYVEADDASLPCPPSVKFEVELAVKLGEALPFRDTPYSRDEIKAAVADVHLGAELLSSAIVESGKVSFPLYIADRIGNRGYALGPPVSKDLLDTIEGLHLKVDVDGSSIYDGPAKHPAGDPLAWLLAYANDGSRPAQSLGKGAVITTGALSGAMPLSGPGRVDVVLEGGHGMSVTLLR